MSIELSDLAKVEKFRQRGRSGRAIEATLHFADGSVYIGDVVGSGEDSILEISGKGVLRRRTEDGEELFVGSFVCGKIDGQGRSTSASGDVYEGGFSKGKRHGKGKASRSGADMVYGIWRNGLLCGPVKRVFGDGSVESAMWKQGVKDPWTVTRVIPSTLRPLIVYITPGAFFNEGTQYLSWCLRVKSMDIRWTAAQRLMFSKSTPRQRALYKLLYDTGGSLPREFVARLQKKLLEESNGRGILLDFPYTVEEAEMLKSWGYEVTACVVMHVDPETLARRSSYVEQPTSTYKEIPFDQLEDKSDVVQRYMDDISPLIAYYSDVYVPFQAELCEGCLSIRQLKRKLYLYRTAEKN